MKQTTRLGVIYLLFFAFMIVTNYMSATNVGTVANQDQALIQPAGFAFSIWGIIYFLLFIWIMRIFFVNRWSGEIYTRIGYWLPANFLLNSLWIIAFTQEWVFLSVIIIIGLLLTLIVIYFKINRLDFRWYDRLPFSIYLGWVSVATIVNVFTWFVQSNTTTFLGLSEVPWTIIMLLVGTLLAVMIAFAYRDIFYPLVFIWAYSAIVVENSMPSIIVVTVICIAIQLALVVFILLRKK
ncbi:MULTISPECIES: tryptophan-rich sensory protein [Bacillaceae]|uniref:ABC transporter permease n=1 Tax=Alkalicoccobacillus plakortidis TaxID=444060 RepID=A0A9D5DW98_9BACI|nr:MULTISPECIES: tryptophan-rich sensory protein [Bacillaceae]KQL58333.1 ABC transporter permease [Alkalicoccobacillus plakortidis]RQW22891.1 tryptophan-rich sensory protein [Bacillus sp. C1-1]